MPTCPLLKLGLSYCEQSLYLTKLAAAFAPELSHINYHISTMHELYDTYKRLSLRLVFFSGESEFVLGKHGESNLEAK
jgi:hypothetical protein